MKNLMVYLNPEKRFNKEHSLLVKIQIDNSLQFGWDRKDILLITNFPYEYNGVKSIIVPDDNYCDFRPLSTKTVTVAWMLENNMIKDDIYWAHDFDAYQASLIDEILLDLRKDIAFSDYGYSKKPSLGSYFFTSAAKDFFSRVRDIIYSQRTEDERALSYLIKNNFTYIADSYQLLNITYNFGMRRVEDNYKWANKPIKVLHFHPWGKDLNTLDIFMYGKNKLGFPLMSEELIKLFNKHGIS